MAKLTVSAEFAAQLLFPATEGGVRIVGAKFDAKRQTIDFTIEGDEAQAAAKRACELEGRSRLPAALRDVHRMTFVSATRNPSSGVSRKT